MNEQFFPMLQLGTNVLLPGLRVPLILETPEAQAVVLAAEHAQGRFVAVPRPDNKYSAIGTVARVAGRARTAGGTDVVIVDVEERAAIGMGVSGTGDALWVEARLKPDSDVSTRTALDLAQDLRRMLESILERRSMPPLAEALSDVLAPGRLADLVGYLPELEVRERLQLLEALDVEERLRLAHALCEKVATEVEVKHKIRSDVAEDMGKAQREFILRKQLETIQKELGEVSDDESLVDGYKKRIAAAELPEDVRKQVERELRRFERTSEQSGEHAYLRNYLDWILDLPWGERAAAEVDLERAQRILDEDHSGLVDVKERIMEHLSVLKLRQERGIEAPRGRGAGAILTLVGPPGVGKTSLGESIARALGRRFARVALGGVRDEAEIRGHRRTYVGAMPGRLVRGLKEAGSMNPVFMLDEIDKVGADWRGDPAAALLEVLDPAQNHAFKDHYLEVPLDLSEVVFICTANVLDTIPPALRDRMEILSLEGYTESEKVAIARDHLLPRQRHIAGLMEDDVVVPSETLALLIRDYTREAGVRGLERQIGKLMRKQSGRIAARSVAVPIQLDEAELRRALGPAKVHHESAMRTAQPGVATGLSVTGAGGEVLFVEASRMGKEDADGAASLVLTGQLGEVMQESARIALSYVGAHSEDLGIPQARFGGGRFHLHVPAGATPKDGPSAGITLVTALVSLLTKRAVRATVGMTGEVTLLGQVLPVGGIKHKVLAAHRAGLTDVIVPRRNENDLDELPAEVRDALRFHLVEHIDEVLATALEPSLKSDDQLRSTG